jgi:hypothetical protein
VRYQYKGRRSTLGAFCRFFSYPGGQLNIRPRACNGWVHGLARAGIHVDFDGYSIASRVSSQPETFGR